MNIKHLIVCVIMGSIFFLSFVIYLCTLGRSHDLHQKVENIRSDINRDYLRLWIDNRKPDFQKRWDVRRNMDINIKMREIKYVLYIKEISGTICFGIVLVFLLIFHYYMTGQRHNKIQLIK